MTIFVKCVQHFYTIIIATICSCRADTGMEQTTANESSTAVTELRELSLPQPETPSTSTAKRIHLAEESQIAAEKESASSQGREDTPASRLRRTRQSTISAAAVPILTPARAEKITAQIARMIVLDIQPISMVEDEGFEELLQLLAPGYAIPSRTTIMRRIKDMHTKLEETLTQKLQKGQSVALTTDSWTSCHTESYVAITVHYVDASWNINSFILQVENTEERHTADNLADGINDTLAKWSLEGRTSAIVHDNAANITAAMQQVNAVSLSCSAHNLQLAVNKALQDTELQSVVQKASSIVGHFNHSTFAISALQKYQKQLNLPVVRLIQCVKTRWNSVYFMLMRLNEQKTAIAAVINDRSVTAVRKAVSLEISQQEWQIIDEICCVLKPLQVATTTLRADKVVTSSSVLPVIFSLVQKFLVLSGAELPVINTLKSRIATELRSRFNLDSDEIIHTPFALASFLDPRFKNMSFLPDQQRQEVASVLHSLASSSSTGLVQVTLNPTALDFLLGADDQESKENTPTGTSEVQRYMLELQINRNEDPLKWWYNNESRYPCLSLIAKKYLCIPATSASSERVFSTSGNIVTHKRSTLTSENVQSLVFLNYNLKRLDA